MYGFTHERRAALKKHAGRAGIALLRAALFITLSFVVLYPLFTKLSASFMTVGDVHDMSVRFIPRHFTLENYRTAWERLGLTGAYPLTIAFVGGVALLQTFSATVIGYGLARFRFRLNRFYLLVVIVGLVVPPDLLLIPLYNQFSYFDLFGLFARWNGGVSPSLINTPWPFLILAATGTGFRCGLYILLMRQFFRGLPKELEEASYIDGAGPVKTFATVILPGARTMMITIFLFAFVWTWLDTSFIPILMADVPVLVNGVGKLNAINVGGQALDSVTRNLTADAGLLFLIVPLLLLYVFTQRFFVQSIERSGLVG